MQTIEGLRHLMVHHHHVRHIKDSQLVGTQVELVQDLVNNQFLGSRL